MSGSRAGAPDRCGTAIRAANVLIWPILSDSTRLALAHFLANQLANHAQELRMNTYGCGTNHVQAAFLGDEPGFGVEVVKHLHVIGNESYRHNYYGYACFQGAQDIADIGL